MLLNDNKEKFEHVTCSSFKKYCDDAINGANFKDTMNAT